MAYVNQPLSCQAAPGPWVDSVDCVCGAVYKSTHYGLRFTDCRELLYQAYERGDWSQFISRGVVLWFMRTLKLAMWFEDHVGCGGLWAALEAAEEQPGQGQGEGTVTAYA